MLGPRAPRQRCASVLYLPTAIHSLFVNKKKISHHHYLLLLLLLLLLPTPYQLRPTLKERPFTLVTGIPSSSLLPPSLSVSSLSRSLARSLSLSPSIEANTERAAVNVIDRPH